MTPYPRGRGRIGRMNPSHRNRSLIINQPIERLADSTVVAQTLSDENAGISPVEQAPNTSTTKSSTWVSKRDRHMQLINTSIYDKEIQARQKAIDETQRQKIHQQGQLEKARIAKHILLVSNNASRSVASIASTELTHHEISIDGVRFQVLKGGSKLSRILGKPCQYSEVR